MGEKNICTSINTYRAAMADGTTIMLGALASVLVLYVVQQERKSGPATLGGKKKPTATVGKALDCRDVALDSPDFGRCSTTLGSGRSVVRSKPRADNMKSSFLKSQYKLGNPFSMKVDDGFKKDTDRKLGSSGGEAFPFSQSGSGSSSLKPHEGEGSGHKFQDVYGKTHITSIEAPPRGSSRSSVTLGSTVENGMKFKAAFLGAAVSPSASLGASPEEMTQSTRKLDGIDKVSSNTGGNLNLLHPL